MKDNKILKNRKRVYEEAILKNPNRWSRKTRNRDKEKKALLNYSQEDKNVDINLSS